MKKFTVIFAVVILSLLFTTLSILLLAEPALAWDGVYGQCIDDQTLTGWAYGGTVDIYSSSGFVVSTTLNSDGTFSVNWTELIGNPNLYIVITYDPGPEGTPGTYIETIPDIPTGAAYNAGYIKTDSGPNAVTLADANAQSPSQWLLAALAAVALVGVGGAVLLFRRRRVA